MKQTHISMLLLLTCWLLVTAAYWLCGPVGPFGQLPLDLGYGLVGALAVPVGCLAVTYAVHAGRPLKLALILLASLGIAAGLFFASLWLPVLVFHGR